MRFRRFWAIFQARNLEFFRDRAGFGWNVFFPFLIVVGFGIIFSGSNFQAYKVGLFPSNSKKVSIQDSPFLENFIKTRHIKFIGLKDLTEGKKKLKHHKIDLLLKIGPPPHQYWINDSSPKGYITEKIFISSLSSPDDSLLKAQRMEIHGKKTRYIDWLLPGVLCMTMMFSSLWGVGYVVVRYRKTGVLKRLKATPLTAVEYLSAQMASRIFVIMFCLVIVWTGCDIIFSFDVKGSYIDLFIIFFLGGLSLTTLGLLIASRGISEEFTSGLVNIISWPMMFLSEVWFSIEDAPEFVKTISKAIPLTNIISSARKIMNYGYQLSDLGTELAIIIFSIVFFLSLGSALFSWQK